jgi:hypothetical protein
MKLMLAFTDDAVNISDSPLRAHGMDGTFLAN